MDGIFVAFLFNVGNNSAVFGFGSSECTGMLGDTLIDIRKPSLARREACNAMIEGLDRGLPPIATWQQLYAWLGKGHGWAYFTPDSAKHLLPHWFVDAEYKCQQKKTNGYRTGPFFDIEAFGENGVQLDTVDEMIGPDAENYGETRRQFDQFGDNFIITRKPIFMV